ncbi:MAG: cobalt ECF transporter T component CbiQ [Microthrixaceae bacterium]
MAPHHRVAAVLAFVVAVVLTPREALWAFGVHAGVLVAVGVAAGVEPTRVLRRTVVEAPIVVFALLLPVLGPDPTTRVAGMNLSVEGLWGAWAILAKATLSVVAVSLLVATTSIPEVLRGLARLRVPALLVAIATLMVRYLQVIADELGRQRVARLARGDDPRWWFQARAMATGVGSTFVRSYERGERVHQAMLSRSFTGTLPVTAEDRVGRWSLALAALAPALAASAMLCAAMG